MRTRPITRRFSRSFGLAAPFARALAALAALPGCGEDATVSPGTGGPAGAGDDRPGESGDPAASNSSQFFLDLHGRVTPPVTLTLDKQKALELFGEDAAKRIRILEMDSTELLGNVLAAIRDACGTGYRRDANDPGYDCSQTALGRSFGPNWRTSPEFSLVRLLGMTAANANLRGTALETFGALVEENPTTFRFDFADVLAESLGVARTDLFIPTSPLVRSLQKNLLGTHPAINNPEGRLPVSLYDALMDLSPLPEELGPVGNSPYKEPREHPGVLVPDDASFRTRSDVLLPTFEMRVIARSNLRRVQGIKLGVGAGDMFLSEGRAPLAFDFDDPASLAISGVADRPTVDMRFRTIEASQFIPRCEGDASCEPFTLEGIVTDAARFSYGTRVYDRCYVSLSGNCLVGVGIGERGASPGWTVFTNAIQGVTVPAPQFTWDMVASVAQAALHDPTGDGSPDIAEGAAAPVFALRGVPIGPSGAELVAAMRPMLQSQADTIADVIAGRYWEKNDDLDFYVLPASGAGPLILQFVGPNDLRPDPERAGEPKPFRHQRPGFFSRPDLSEANRVSRRDMEGIDNGHERYALSPGRTVLYAEDEAGDVYEIRLFVPQDEPLQMVVEMDKVGRSG